MAPWKRPGGPLNVWKVIDGYEKLKDGTQRSVKFSIQDVPNDQKRHKELLDLLTTHFLADEPLCKSVNIKEDSDGVEGFHKVWQYGLEQGVVIGCYKLDCDGNISELVGANALFIMTDDTSKYFAEYKKAMKSVKLEKMWGLFERLSHKADVREIYNVDSYIGSISLSVLPDYRGQKLGFHILNARGDMAKKYGFSVTSSMFTAEASQLQAKRAGFEERCSVDYDELVDDEGNPQFPNITSKSAKIMMKRFP